MQNPFSVGGTALVVWNGHSSEGPARPKSELWAQQPGLSSGPFLCLQKQHPGLEGHTWPRATTSCPRGLERGLFQFPGLDPLCALGPGWMMAEGKAQGPFHGC